MEAEYVALSEATQEAIWLRRLLEEWNESQQRPTIIFEDNMSCLDFVALDQQKKRSKHIDMRFHYAKSCCTFGDIELQYCASEFMLVDNLTKPIRSIKVKKLATDMGLATMPINQEVKTKGLIREDKCCAIL